jgi:hypothetical protein
VLNIHLSSETRANITGAGYLHALHAREDNGLLTAAGAICRQYALETSGLQLATTHNARWASGTKLATVVAAPGR